MIPRIYDRTFENYESNGLGLLRDVIECYVEEESNGIFELFIKYPVDSFLCEYIQRENIIKADASKSLKGQLFRIYHVSKPLDGIISAYARHITFDLANDTLNEDIKLQDMTCQGAGNSMLSRGDFSSKFTIHSDIEMVGNYSMDRKTDCLSAIAGTRGSLIDTFGNGPKLLRDNFDIHILKRRGSDNNVLIAYGKNLTGFELEEDDSDLITRIKPYATYTDDEQNPHIVYGTAVDSSRIDSYSVIRSVWMDFSDKFKEDEEVTQSKLNQMAINYFTNNKCDLPKMTYKVEFELLSQTEEYKDYEILEDIDMDDGVYIFNSKYGIRDQAKVVKTKYNPIAEKYISIELGEPRTSLSNILGNTSGSVTKDEVQDMIDSSINGAEGVAGADGVSIRWQGTFAEHPENPENGWAYYNSTDKKSYVYQGGTWYQMTVDGNDGIDGNDGLSITWQGESTSAPSNPQVNWVYKDTDNGIVYIYTGTAWEVMTYDGNDGIDGTDGSNGLSVFITYNDSEDKPNAPTGDGTTNGWHTDCTDYVIWMSQKIAENATSGEWGTPIRIKGEKGDPGISGSDASFPDTLPDIPRINIDREGFKTISLSWTFNSKPYYTYEIYASQERGFTPTAFDLIYAGVGSSFLHEVECSQTWYYRARVVNTYDHATGFSAEVSATTTKISDAAEYFEEAAIGSALIGDLNADKITSGTIKGDYIDAKNLKIVDGNGNITLYVSSDGTIQNLTLYKRENDGSIIGKIELSAQGMNIFDNNGDIVSYFKTDSSYVKYLAAEIVKAGNLVMDVTKTGMSNNLYVVSEGTYIPEYDKESYFYGIQEAIYYIYDNGKYLSEDITINLEDNLSIIESNLYIPDFLGNGNLIIKFGNRTHITLLGSIVVDNCSAEILFTSNKTYDNINTVDYYDMIGNGMLITNQEPILKGFGNCKITFDSLRLRSYLNSTTGCVEAYDNCNMIVQNCDILNFGYVGFVSEGGEFRIHNSCGITNYVCHGYAGGKAFIPSGIVPSYKLAQYVTNDSYNYYVNTTSSRPIQATTRTFVETAPNGESGGLYDYGKFQTSSSSTTASKLLKGISYITYQRYETSSGTFWEVESTDKIDMGTLGIVNMGDISYFISDTVTVNKVTLYFTAASTHVAESLSGIRFGIMDAEGTSVSTIWSRLNSNPEMAGIDLISASSNSTNWGTLQKGMMYKVELTNGSYLYDNTTARVGDIVLRNETGYGYFSSVTDMFNQLTTNHARGGKFNLGVHFVSYTGEQATLECMDVKLKIEYTDTQVSVEP